MKLFLIGMPGSGKTYLGRQLANALKLKFIDLDSQIEKQEHEYIKNIVNVKGEDYFRIQENQILKKIVGNQQILVSCGGGVPMFFDNLETMKREGIVIWINTDLSLISDRIKQNRSRRPMFDGLNDEEIDKKVVQLYQIREKVYKKADINLELKHSLNNPLSAVIQKIMKITRSRK